MIKDVKYKEGNCIFQLSGKISNSVNSVFHRHAE